MASSTSASRPLARFALALCLVAVPALGAWVGLAPSRDGSAVPPPAHFPPVAMPADTDVVFIGNSKAGSDFDPPTFAAAFGEDAPHVEVISIGSATLPIYYAVVKNQVFSRATPKLIIVYATGVEILNSDLTTDRREILLRRYLVEDEPVFARKLYRHTPGGFEGLRERAVRSRDATLSAFSAGIAGLMTGRPGREALDGAFTEVFGQSWATRQPANLDTIPKGGYPSESALPQLIEDSFVLEFEAMVHEHGAKLVYARAPMTGKIREREETRLRGLEPLLTQAAAHADAWIEMPYPGDGPEFWRDDEHMQAAAAVPNTQTLAAELRRRGLLP